MAKHIIVSVPQGSGETTLGSTLSSFFQTKWVVFRDQKQALNAIESFYDNTEFIFDLVPDVAECLKLIESVNQLWPDVRLILFTQDTLGEVNEINPPVDHVKLFAKRGP